MEATKKILIYPTDLMAINPISDYGVLLAKSMGVPAILVDVESIPVVTAPDLGAGAVSAIPVHMTMNEVRERADARLKQMQKLASHLYDRTNYEIEVGFPEPELLEKTKEKNTLLLIIGQSSEFNFLNEWLGTFETRMAGKADCPVLVLPDRISWMPVQTILYVMDMQQDKSEEIADLSKIAQKLNARIDIIAFDKEADEKKWESFTTGIEQLKRTLHNQQINYFLHNYENPDEKALEYMKAGQANWLAVQKQDYNFFERLFSNRQFERLILKSDFPVLVF